MSTRPRPSETARSLQKFDIGIENIPKELIHAFGALKRAAVCGRIGWHLLVRLD